MIFDNDFKVKFTLRLKYSILMPAIAKNSNTNNWKFGTHHSIQLFRNQFFDNILLQRYYLL